MPPEYWSPDKALGRQRTRSAPHQAYLPCLLCLQVEYAHAAAHIHGAVQHRLGPPRHILLPQQIPPHTRVPAECSKLMEGTHIPQHGIFLPTRDGDGTELSAKLGIEINTRDVGLQACQRDSNCQWVGVGCQHPIRRLCMFTQILRSAKHVGRHRRCAGGRPVAQRPILDVLAVEPRHHEPCYRQRRRNGKPGWPPDGNRSLPVKPPAGQHGRLEHQYHGVNQHK